MRYLVATILLACASFGSASAKPIKAPKAPTDVSSARKHVVHHAHRNARYLGRRGGRAYARSNRVRARAAADLGGIRVDTDGRWQPPAEGHQQASQERGSSTFVGGSGASFAGSIVSHPDGCPRTAFCGCGVAKYVFGQIHGAMRRLWLGREWFGFPRAEPGPGMVAVRQHHVFAIVRNLGNGRVLAYDPNSGGHRTRIHVRPLAGYRVVNPHGHRA